MPLKKSAGNMYDWVTHTHTHLGGECLHGCSYCYVDNPRFGRPARYAGPLRLIEEEFAVNYGERKIIFLENCNDLFAAAVPDDWILRILKHAWQYPTNEYVFQSKNPGRMVEFFHDGNAAYSKGIMLGTTIESNEMQPGMGKAPHPSERIEAMSEISQEFKTFITIEPIMACDPDLLAQMVIYANPSFVNIGADSKGRGLAEPTMNDVLRLIRRLTEAGIHIRKKVNLERLVR